MKRTLSLLMLGALAGAVGAQDPTPLARQYETLEALHPFAVVQQYDFALDRDKPGEQLVPYVKCAIKPLLDVPLRDASICRGGDGNYYMVGTQGVSRRDGTVDFQNSLTIKIWKSADGVRWRELTTAWNIADPRVYTPHPQRTPQRWMQFFRLDPDDPAAGWVRGITTPEIHYLKGTYWIPFALNNQETGLLKSTTGLPEGPYQNIAHHAAGRDLERQARVTTRGGSPSLFADDDGTVYFVWGAGWIAKLKDDLTGLAERPRLLQCEPNSAFGDYPMLVGRTGAHLFKVNGKYHLTAMDINPRLNKNPCHDTFVAVADHVYGPYGPRELLIPHGGQITTFRDAKGRLNAALSGSAADPFARCPDRPAIAPLLFDGFLGRAAKRYWVVTEAGLVSTLKPAWDVTANEPVKIRDPLVTYEPDGYYYCAGTTGKDKNGIPGARIWRSKDLKRWERIQRPGSDDGFIWSAAQAEWSAKPEPAATSALGVTMHDLWGPQLFAHHGTYWIPYMMFCRRTTSILKSTTGQPAGPYVDTEFKWKDGAPHLFKDTDGSVYLHFCFGPPRIGKMKPDLSGFAIPPRDITYHDFARQGYEGTWLIKIGKKYVLFHTDWNGEDKAQSTLDSPRNYGTYDWSYSTSDNILDGWSKPRPLIPHGGTGSVFRDKHGRWWAALFGTDPTAPLPQQLGFVPLIIETRRGDVQIRVADQFPPGYDMSRNNFSSE
jgi:beta-xylosidase